MKSYLANFRFYEELNEFLSPEHYKQTIEYQFKGQPSVKDAIEVLGVPHSEFYCCNRCHKVYWKGSQVVHMNDTIRQMIDFQ